ncbi:hypothetical protein TFLX_06067 [Thermoflexales bacterium]|nr:hypothetical protein TFLX_06067 [Thermoflexales bacterium]
MHVKTNSTITLPQATTKLARCMAALALGLSLIAWLGIVSGVSAQSLPQAALALQVALAPQAALAPEAPSVILTKTVGTDPAVCAATQAITLPIGGGPAYYCYTIRNSGTISLTRHTLVDNRLGTVLSNFPYTLLPGASAFITQAAVITVTTINSATWTAFNPGPIEVVSDSDTAIVNVIPSLPAIALAKTVGTDPAVCAATKTITLTAGGSSNVTYCYTVRNTGNLTLTRHTLIDDRLGTLLLDFPYSLVPGASAFLTQAAVITGTTINSATWTAFNPGPVNSISWVDTATVVLLSRVYLPLIRRG